MNQNDSVFITFTMVTLVSVFLQKYNTHFLLTRSNVSSVTTRLGTRFFDDEVPNKEQAFIQ